MKKSVVIFSIFTMALMGCGRSRNDVPASDKTGQDKEVQLSLIHLEQGKLYEGEIVREGSEPVKLEVQFGKDGEDKLRIDHFRLSEFEVPSTLFELSLYDERDGSIRFIYNYTDDKNAEFRYEFKGKAQDSESIDGDVIVYGVTHMHPTFMQARFGARSFEKLSKVGEAKFSLKLKKDEVVVLPTSDALQIAQEEKQRLLEDKMKENQGNSEQQGEGSPEENADVSNITTQSTTSETSKSTVAQTDTSSISKENAARIVSESLASIHSAMLILSAPIKSDVDPISTSDVTKSSEQVENLDVQGMVETKE
ncbi:MAG: hypothetical protein HYS98_00095 [Deltaproteobacteria bacterium]|nr:hypothetical protein [Deltaproteobacteria bacterium]